jgi:glutathione S-transferase
MYILYGGDFTRAPLVQWLLEEAGLTYDLRKVDLLKGEHRTPEYLALNPAGLVPLLITPEGQRLHEVAALMLFLADRHQLSTFAPLPDDPDRGPFLSAVLHVAGDIQPEMKRYHFPHRYSLRREDDATVQAMAKAMVLDRLAVTDTRLAGRGPYTLGERFSLADFYLCFWIAFLDRKAACQRYPAIARLYDEVYARPKAAFYLDLIERDAKAYDAMQRCTPGGVIT